LVDVISVAINEQPKTYPIIIDPKDGLTTLGELLRTKIPNTTKALVISDPAVAPLYLQTVCEALQSKDFTIGTFITPTIGEGAKTLSVAQSIYSQAHHMDLSRQDVIIALGGGVVGDLAGFCASTYYRGTAFVQIPTTLLAQVDSSVGGKVAVNFNTSKNGIGSFYQPQLVLIDPNTLLTLPYRELKAGMAEVLKYALLQQSIAPHWPEDFLATLGRFTPKQPTDYIPIIKTCCQLKAIVVLSDETETKGLRALLNLGHTFAHAYEAITGYSVFLHGEAVAIGMDHACQFAVDQGLLPPEQYQRYIAVAKHLGLSDYPPLATQASVSATALLDLMTRDKKTSAGQLTLVLPQHTLGKVVLTRDFNTSQLYPFLKALLEKA
jgi:3-dehydroquinate synthase